jgi:hypothetical protein
MQFSETDIGIDLMVKEFFRAKNIRESTKRALSVSFRLLF